MRIAALLAVSWFCCALLMVSAKTIWQGERASISNCVRDTKLIDITIEVPSSLAVLSQRKVKSICPPFLILGYIVSIFLAEVVVLGFGYRFGTDINGNYCFWYFRYFYSFLFSSIDEVGMRKAWTTVALTIRARMRARMIDLVHSLAVSLALFLGFFCALLFLGVTWYLQ